MCKKQEVNCFLSTSWWHLWYIALGHRAIIVASYCMALWRRLALPYARCPMRSITNHQDAVTIDHRNATVLVRCYYDGLTVVYDFIFRLLCITICFHMWKKSWYLQVSARSVMELKKLPRSITNIVPTLLRLLKIENSWSSVGKLVYLGKWLKVPMKRKLSLSNLKEILKCLSNILCSFSFPCLIFEIIQFLWYVNWTFWPHMCKMIYRRRLYIFAIDIRNQLKIYMFGAVGETHAHDAFE